MSENTEQTVRTDIDIAEILARIPHRYPFLLVDRAEDYKPGQSIVGIKCVTINEPFFQGHFPGNPVMPGVLIIEALAQTGAVLMSKTLDVDTEGKTIFFMSIDGVRFRNPVRPGDVIRMEVEVVRARSSIFKFKGVAKIAADVEVGPYSIVGPDVTLEAGVRLLSHVVVEGATTIGENCIVHPFANLGGPPQHLGHKGERTELLIGPRNIIREHVTMHTGTASGRGVTTIGSDGLYMVGSHVAHDCIVGDFVVLAKGATLGGHVAIGDYVFMGGLAAAHQFSRIGRYSFIGGLAAVTKDVIPYGSVWGNHAHLEGLNLVGLKRRGFSRETINALRAAYRLMFADEGTFQERLDDVAETHAAITEVMEIVDFIRADANRPLCLPEREI